MDTFGPHNTEADIADYVSSAFTPCQIERELADSKTVFLLAEDSEGPIGFAKLRNGPVPDCVLGWKPVELERLYVDKTWFGRGVAALLMAAVLSEADSRDHQSVWLGVWEHNLRARAFYKKYGFEVVGTKDFFLGDDRQTDLIMERPSDSGE